MQMPACFFSCMGLFSTRLYTRWLYFLNRSVSLAWGGGDERSQPLVRNS